ncbi:MAG: CHAT domain-containing protein [Oscillatoria sp. SIO1A7]|nr:CHAT domain-containing protein [Oscillatoria sp. SIO1A7]
MGEAKEEYNAITRKPESKISGKAGDRAIALLAAMAAIAVASNPSLAQTIVPANDGTGTIVTEDGNSFKIEGGQVSADKTNLFHSFEKLNLDSDRVANFISNQNIRNILGRVTGGDPSLINGLLEVTGGNSNLFLINPAGIIFGTDATLNLPGAFVATSATGIGFGNNWFDAIGSNDYAALVGTPSALSFAGWEGAIANFGNLAVSEGSQISLIGSSVLTDGNLAAPGGKIEILAIPEQNILRLSEKGYVLSLDIPLNLRQGGQEGPLESLRTGQGTLGELLTGGDFGHATAVDINPDGTIKLTGSGVTVYPERGTIALGNIDVAIALGNIDVAHRLQGGNVKILAATDIILDGTIDAQNLALEHHGTKNHSIQIMENATLNVTGDFRQSSDRPVSLSGILAVPGASLTFGSPIVLAGDVKINSGGGDIRFQSALDGTNPGRESLDLIAETGTIFLESGAGNAVPPNFLSTDSTTNITGEVRADFLDFGGELYLSGNVVLSANDINFSDAVNGKGKLTLQTLSGDRNIVLGDADSFGLVLSEADLGQLQDGFESIKIGRADRTGDVEIESISVSDPLEIVSGSGSIFINDDIAVTDNADLTLEAEQIRLGADVTLSTTSGNIVLNSPIDGNRKLTVNSDRGDITFGEAIGSNTSLRGLEVTTTGKTSLGGNIAIRGNSAGGVRFGGETSVELTTDVTIDASQGSGDIVFEGTLDGSYQLTVDAGPGDVSFESAVGSLAPLNGLDIIDAKNVAAAETLAIADGGINIIAKQTVSLMGNATSSGLVNVEAGRNISTGDIASESGIVLSAIDGDLAVGNLDSSSATGAGGDITIVSEKQTISAGNLNASGATDGGEIWVEAYLAITAGEINSSGASGAGGNVTLDPIGDIEVTWINAEGGTNGGTVDITAGGFFRAMGTFSDAEGQAASISTIGSSATLAPGSNGSGSITIRHGGGGTTPFIVGDATTNGTAGRLVSSQHEISSGSFLYTHTVGDISLVSVPEPIDSGSSAEELADSDSGSSGSSAEELADSDSGSSGSSAEELADSDSGSSGSSAEELADSDSGSSGSSAEELADSGSDSGSSAEELADSDLSAEQLTDSPSVSGSSGLSAEQLADSPSGTSGTSAEQLADSPSGTSGTSAEQLADSPSGTSGTSAEQLTDSPSVSGSSAEQLADSPSGTSGTSATSNSVNSVDLGDSANSNTANSGGGATSSSVDPADLGNSISPPLDSGNSGVATNSGSGNSGVVQNSEEVMTTVPPVSTGSGGVVPADGGLAAPNLTPQPNPIVEEASVSPLAVEQVLAEAAAIPEPTQPIAIEEPTTQPIINIEAPTTQPIASQLPNAEATNIEESSSSPLTVEQPQAENPSSESPEQSDLDVTFTEIWAEQKSPLENPDLIPTEPILQVEPGAIPEVNIVESATAEPVANDAEAAAVESDRASLPDSGETNEQTSSADNSEILNSASSSAPDGGETSARTSSADNSEILNSASSSATDGGETSARTSSADNSEILNSASSSAPDSGETSARTSSADNSEILNSASSSATDGGETSARTSSADNSEILNSASSSATDSGETSARTSSADNSEILNSASSSATDGEETSSDKSQILQSDRGSLADGEETSSDKSQILQSDRGSLADGEETSTTEASHNLSPTSGNDEEKTQNANSDGDRGEEVNLDAAFNSDDIVGTVWAIEQTRNLEFGQYLGVTASLPSQSLAINNFQEVLKNIETQTGFESAILYVVARSEQLELVLVPPTGDPIRRSIPEAARDIILPEVAKFSREIVHPRKRITTSYLPHAQQLYRWIIEPVTEDLEKLGVQTLLISLDAGLRSMPIAALHDGNQFLIEKYSLSLIPSFSLTATGTAKLEQPRVLAMGASQFANLNPLPAVPLELELVTGNKEAIDRGGEPRLPLTSSGSIPNSDLQKQDCKSNSAGKCLSRGQFFLNEAFTVVNLQSQRKEGNYNIIHLATHAEFLPGIANNSFIQMWGDRLQLDEMPELNWHEPQVDLLVLSACRTAVGDREAELGFAGLAVHSGVRSAIASLWYVSDEGTLGLMSEFYRHLSNSSIKVEALRQAQLGMIRGQMRVESGMLVVPNGSIQLPTELSSPGSMTLDHPYYWSAFTTIGSPW